jgi:hypothetical protein
MSLFRSMLLLFMRLGTSQCHAGEYVEIGRCCWEALTYTLKAIIEIFIEDFIELRVWVRVRP